MTKKVKDFETILKQFVTSQLRRASMRWPPRSEAMKLARVERGLYKCAMCNELYGPKEIALDHKEPVVSVTNGYTDYNDFVRRLLCPADGYQVICHTCHDTKTMMEDTLRALNNAKRKEQEKIDKKKNKE